MGCVRASGAPDSSRRQPETSQEVCSCTLNYERGATKTSILAEKFHFASGSMVQRLHHRWRNDLNSKSTVLQENGISLTVCRRRCCR